MPPAGDTQISKVDALKEVIPGAPIFAKLKMVTKATTGGALFPPRALLVRLVN
jgi:hypothetical protein